MSFLVVEQASIPEGWALKPLKAVAQYVVSNVDKVPDETEEPIRLCNYTDVYKNEFIRSSMAFMYSTATQREIERFQLRDGGVIITKDSEAWEDIAVPALVVESADDLVCGYHLAILRPLSDQLDGRFLFRCLQSKAIRLPLELASTGVTRFGLPIDEIGRLQLPIPPRREQRRIAEYLDRETAEIDTLIAEKERMLALLDEKRAALVTRAVTRGLDSKVKLKPSGLDWLGDVPAHWRIERLKFQLSRQIEQGWSPQCENRLADEDEWGVLKVGCVNGATFTDRCAIKSTFFRHPIIRYGNKRLCSA
jgi:type I restriction enzyme S subunit